MKPLAAGVGIAIILAGPPLHSLVQAGSITGTTALTRGLIVAGVCTLGASFLNSIVRDYARDAEKKAAGEVVHHPADGSGHGPGQTITGQTITGQTVGQTIQGETIPARTDS